MASVTPAETLTSETLISGIIKGTLVVSMIYEGIRSVRVGFSNGVFARLHPAEDCYSSYIGEKVLEVMQFTLGAYSFFKIQFESGREWLFRA